MAILYPDSFRCAQITPYQVTVDMGLLRTPMEGGNARQRRLYRTMPHAFALEFVMTVQELGAWQTWVNANAYDWFTMAKLETYFAGKLGLISSPHSIRFTSNLSFDNPVYGWVRVKVGAELDPLQESNAGPIEPSGNWIIAGSPDDPSNANNVDSGIPEIVPLDFVQAGTPSAPAA